MALAVAAIPATASGGQQRQGQGRVVAFFHKAIFFLSQPVITFTRALPELTTKRAAQSASALYMVFMKQ